VPGVGNSANAAVAFARMGFKTAIYTHCGDDIVGDSIKKVFTSEKVALDYVVVEKGMPSNYSVVLNYGAERTILVHHESWKYNLPKGLKTDWFYFSSLGPIHQKLHKQIFDYVKRDGVKLAYQPGSYQLREGKTGEKLVLQSTHVLLLNKEEGQMLLGKGSIKTKLKPSSKGFVKKIMEGLHKLGPKVVVVTDGPHGAYVYDGQEAWFVDIFPVPAKERTGAGDSFSTGLIGALAYDRPLGEALLWGNANSTSVTQYIGAQAGLLRVSGIKKLIKKYKRIKPVKI
jgi:sugar/nucleoside kinase (ribokinase family)